MPYELFIGLRYLKAKRKIDLHLNYYPDFNCRGRARCDGADYRSGGDDRF